MRPFPTIPCSTTRSASPGAPRQYGFHGTLKAPFALAEGRTEDQLRTALAEFAERRHPVAFDLKLALVGHFLALVPAAQSQALQHLADDCVRHFDPFRAPLTPADRERRHPEDLIERQVENLDTWGYPYVFEDFMFHMTLTGDLEPADRHRLEPVLQELLSAVSLRFTIDALALFIQRTPEERFVALDRFPFAR